MILRLGRDGMGYGVEVGVWVGDFRDGVYRRKGGLA